MKLLLHKILLFVLLVSPVWCDDDVIIALRCGYHDPGVTEQSPAAVPHSHQHQEDCSCICHVPTLPASSVAGEIMQTAVPAFVLASYTILEQPLRIIERPPVA